MMKRGIAILTAVILTAQLGTVNYGSHRETYYNLKMSRICQRAAENGIAGEYRETEDGMKMYGDYIICAADWNTYPYGSIIETSRGLGIVLDTHTSASNIVDLAVTW